LIELLRKKTVMQRISSRLSMAMLFATAVLLLPVAVVAQSFWLDRSPNKTLGVEIFKPRLYSGVYNGVSYPVDYSFQTAAFFFSLRWPVGKKTFLVAELPFAHAAFDKKIDRPFSFYRNNGRESAFGNPYLGLEFWRTTSRIFAEVGIRFPLVVEDRGYAVRVGAASALDREEAFLDFAAVKAAINYRLLREAGLVFRLHLGAAYWRNFETSDYRGAIPLAIRLGYKTGRYSAGVFLAQLLEGRNEKRSNVFNKGSYFSFKLTQQQGLWANMRLGKLQPGVVIESRFVEHVFDSFALNLGVQLQ